MTMKQMLGLENTKISDEEIMTAINNARKQNNEAAFTQADGSQVTVNVPPFNIDRYMDPWDGKKAKLNVPLGYPQMA